jgi:hypothetical protein
MPLTKEQRDALRKLLHAVGPGVHYTKEIDEATKEIAAAFADALRPPKMATRGHKDGAGDFWRILRVSGEKDRWQYRRGEYGRWRDAQDCDKNADALLAAARDTEFHEVTD